MCNIDSLNAKRGGFNVKDYSLEVHGCHQYDATGSISTPIYLSATYRHPGLWLDCSDVGLTAEQLDRVIVERGNLWLDSGRIFGHAGEGFQRINMACPWSVLKNGLEHLKLALRDR